MATPERTGPSPVDKILDVWSLETAEESLPQRPKLEVVRDTPRVISDDARRTILKGYMDSVGRGFTREQAIDLYNRWDVERPISLDSLDV